MPARGATRAIRDEAARTARAGPSGAANANEPGPDPFRVARALLAGLPPVLLAELRAAFDASYYRAVGEPIAAECDALEHYIAHGWREGRDPSRDFSTRFYLERYPDIRRAGVNPFVHYVRIGRARGRLPRAPGGWKQEAIARSRLPAAMRRDWTRQDAEPEGMAANGLRDWLLALASPATPELVLALSHDDHRTVGGVQLCIQNEVRSAARHGRIVVAVRPWQPLPTLADPDADPLLCLYAPSGETAHAHGAALVEAVRGLDGFGAIHLVIHHLMGHAPERVADLALAAGGERIAWLHDFFTLCPSYALQRNGVAFCGAPDPSSNACEICVYGGERPEHLRRIGAFIERAGVRIVSPSAAALDLWRSRGDHPAGATVVAPHMVPSPLRSGEADPTVERAGGAALRVAHVGATTPQKGWATFERLHDALAERADVEFWRFGSGDVAPGRRIRSVAVSVSADAPDAMARALRENAIDVVVNWTGCFETFSFAAHEALAAGAIVLTGPASGNVAAMVRQSGRGAVLADEDALLAFLADGGARTLVGRCRARGAPPNLVLGDMSHAVLPSPAAPSPSAAAECGSAP